MIRLIVRIDDAGMAANVGGPVQTTYRTFDIEHPELEEALQSFNLNYRSIVGAEIVKAEPEKEPTR